MSDSPDYKKDLWGHLVKIKASSFSQSIRSLKRKVNDGLEEEKLVFSLRKMSVLDPPEVQLEEGFKKLRLGDEKTTFRHDSSPYQVSDSSTLLSCESNGPVHSHCVQKQPLAMAAIIENGEMDPDLVPNGLRISSARIQDEVLTDLLHGDSFSPVLPSVLEEDCDWLNRIDHRLWMDTSLYKVC